MKHIIFIAFVSCSFSDSYHIRHESGARQPLFLAQYQTAPADGLFIFEEMYPKIKSCLPAYTQVELEIEEELRNGSNAPK